MTGARRRRRLAGFALPSVLFVVAMVTLVFLVAIEALASLAAETRQVKTGVAFEAAALSLEAHTTFLAATQPLGPGGVLAGDSITAPTLLALDGRAYDAGGDFALAAQDEAGLINLDSLPAPARPRLFAAMGVAPAAQTAMADRLGDYMDPGDLKRPQGADSADYLRAGLPAPPKGPLARRAQALGLLGWRQWVGPYWRGFADNVTADPSSSASNVNTATAATLEVLYGLTPAQAQAALARRARTPFTELEDLGRAVGLKLPSDAERSYTMPNGRIALRVEDAAAGLAYRSRLILSPDDPTRPFWIVEPTIAQLSAAERVPLPAHAPHFPDPAD